MKFQRHAQLVMLSASSGLMLLGLLLLASAGAPTAFADPGNLFVAQAGSGSTCSQAAPCALAKAIEIALAGDTIYVAGGTYKGVGDAVITVTSSITLYGGWNGAPSGQIVRNPALYPSTLNGERARRVLHISGDITPTIDGFVIAHGNASGLYDAWPANADGIGGGIYIYNAHPIISHNVITDNVAVLTASGSVSRTTGYGGGIYMRDANRSIISSNTIISNAASTAQEGQGGGIYLPANHQDAMILSNQIISNSATTGNFYGLGGGIFGGPDGALIQANIIEGNQTNSVQDGGGSGLYQNGGSAQYIRNLVRGNGGAYAVHLNYSRSLFEGNQVVNNNATEGVTLWSKSGNGPVLVNNIIFRSGSKTISVRGSGSVMTATLLHNTLVGSGSGYGIYSRDANVYITNTMVVSHSLGITNTTLASSNVLPDHTLFSGNGNDGIRGTNPVDGAPGFVNPMNVNFHLVAGSAAIDTGIATWVTTDIDGDLRPMSTAYDIGADEAPNFLMLPMMMKP